MGASDSWTLLESQAVLLIYLIDNIHTKCNTVLLEGYLSLHQRECQLSVCPCHDIRFRLQQDEEQVTENMRQLQLQAFALLVITLN